MSKKSESKKVMAVSMNDRIQAALNKSSRWTAVDSMSIDGIYGKAVRLENGLFANLANGTAAELGLQSGNVISGICRIDYFQKDGILKEKATLFIESINGLTDWGEMTTTDDNRADREL